MDRAAQLLIILMIEAAVGYPQAIYRAVRHPVVWMGALISGLESRWNIGSAPRRRLAGCALLIVLAAIAGGAGWALEWASETGWPGAAFAVLAATTMLAQRSLHDHVAAVLKPLKAG